MRDGICYAGLGVTDVGRDIEPVYICGRKRGHLGRHRDHVENMEWTDADKDAWQPTYDAP